MWLMGTFALAVCPGQWGCMILLIDNYDSFVFNLARYFERLGAPTTVVRNDAIEGAEVRRLRPDALVFSPGPCTPTEAGNSLALVTELLEEFPMLGVCLGHQTIAAALGGRVVRASQPMHGRASQVIHDGAGIFKNLANPFTVGRYHSLIVDEPSLPTCLRVTARTTDGVIMAIEHTDRPVFGVQFHPESSLTEQGYVLLKNFLDAANVTVDNPVMLEAQQEFVPLDRPTVALPSRPVTF